MATLCSPVALASGVAVLVLVLAVLVLATWVQTQ
jgi:hypothetical protein